jgi:hypothetical protein
MTRKDYIAFAAAFKKEMPGANWDPNKRVQWALDILAVAAVLQADNGRFNRARFLTACGYTE